MASFPLNLMPSAKDGVLIDMTDMSNVQMEAQASMNVKGAKTTKASKVSKISATMTRARRKFQQQLKKNQNLQTKIDCIEEAAEEIYGKSAKAVWHNLLEETMRLTNLIDFNTYCRSLGLDPSCVAQHIVFEGSGVVNKVMRNGVENELGAEIFAYEEPLFNPMKATGKTFTIPQMKVARVTAGQLMAKAQVREKVAEAEVVPSPIAESEVEEETAA